MSLLRQFNQGKSVLQLFIASRSMFMDAEFMYNNAYPDKGSAAKRLPDTVTGLSETYKDIAGMGINRRHLFVFPSETKVVFVFTMTNTVYIFDKHLRRS